MAVHLDSMGNQPQGLWWERLRSSMPLLVLAAILTLVAQVYIGLPELYLPHADKVAATHQAFITNTPLPGKSWTDMGLNGTNVRRLAPTLANALRDVGVPLKYAYFLIDTAALYLQWLLLYVWLRKFVPRTDAVIGLLFTAAILPLTYQFFYYHPWDRLSQVFWLIALMQVVDRRLWAFLGISLVAAVNKYDLVALPVLWAVLHWSKGAKRRLVAEVVLVMVCNWLMMKGLTHLWPGGFPDMQASPLDRALKLMSQSLTHFKQQPVAYPPLLMFGLPVVGAALAWRRLSWELKCMTLFGLALFGPLLAASYVREVRAQMGLYYLILPAGLLGARQWWQGQAVTVTAAVTPSGPVDAPQSAASPRLDTGRPSESPSVPAPSLPPGRY